MSKVKSRGIYCKVELPPDDDVESNSILNCMLTWYKFNSVTGPFYFEV